MANFDEKSGIVPSVTPWGKWWQTLEEVHVEISVPENTKSKELLVKITTKSITVVLNGQEILSGDLFATIHADEAIWTLEDKKLVHVCLPKSRNKSDNCWKALLKTGYEVDPVTYDQMEQKMTLERFQLENPGFDFSGATISGNYHKGGPQLN